MDNDVVSFTFYLTNVPTQSPHYAALARPFNVRDNSHLYNVDSIKKECLHIKSRTTIFRGQTEIVSVRP